MLYFRFAAKQRELYRGIACFELMIGDEDIFQSNEKGEK